MDIPIGKLVTITSIINSQPLDLAWQDIDPLTPIITDNKNGGKNQQVTAV